MTDYSGQLKLIIETLHQINMQLAANFSNITSFVAALASLFAAGASSWAASSAYRAMKNVRKLARLGLLRDLIKVTHDVISESEQAKLLVEQIKIEIQTLGLFSGSTGSSAENTIKKDAEGKYNEVIPLQREAQRTIADRPQLEKKEEDELSQQLSKFDGYLSQVRRVRSHLEKEAESYAEQNRMHRMNIINRRP